VLVVARARVGAIGFARQMREGLVMSILHISNLNDHSCDSILLFSLNREKPGSGEPSLRSADVSDDDDNDDTHPSAFEVVGDEKLKKRRRLMDTPPFSLHDKQILLDIITVLHAQVRNMPAVLLCVCLVTHCVMK
jgi:hypothetical protein